MSEQGPLFPPSVSPKFSGPVVSPEDVTVVQTQKSEESGCTNSVPRSEQVQAKRRWGLSRIVGNNSFRGQDHKNWSVKRCAALDEATRIALGGRTSPQTKTECSSLKVFKRGVIGEACGSRQEIRDYNDYRSRGHRGKFEPCTFDRAVSLLSITVYEELQRKLPRAHILHGDLGENLLIEGPSHTGTELHVGTVLQIGDDVVVELTEANTPCFRLAYLKWAPEARRLFGEKWWNSQALPLMANQASGGRGWLAKVIVEGIVAPGALVQVLSKASP